MIFWVSQPDMPPKKPFLIYAIKSSSLYIRNSSIQRITILVKITWLLGHQSWSSRAYGLNSSYFTGFQSDHLQTGWNPLAQSMRSIPRCPFLVFTCSVLPFPPWTLRFNLADCKCSCQTFPTYACLLTHIVLTQTQTPCAQYLSMGQFPLTEQGHSKVYSSLKFT